MVEYYKTKNNYYYKKTKKQTKRISKNEFIKSTKNGAMVRMYGGNSCDKCDNQYDIITLEPIKNFDKNDINNFHFIENDKCWCFKVYDLYQWVFVTDIPINIDAINRKKRNDVNPYTNIPITNDILEQLIIKYNEWVKFKGIEKTISYNGVTFNKKDFNNIKDEYKLYLDKYINTRGSSVEINELKIFNSFVKETLDIRAEFSNSNNNSNNNLNNNSAKSSFDMKENKLKAILSYMRVKNLYKL